MNDFRTDFLSLTIAASLVDLIFFLDFPKPPENSEPVPSKLPVDPSVLSKMVGKEWVNLSGPHLAITDGWRTFFPSRPTSDSWEALWWGGRMVRSLIFGM